MTQRRARAKAKVEVLVTLCSRARTMQPTRLKTDSTLRWTGESCFWTLLERSLDSADEVEAAAAHEADSAATEAVDSEVVTVEVAVTAKTEVTEAEVVTAGATVAVIEVATEAADEAAEAVKVETTETNKSINTHCFAHYNTLK